MALLSLGLAYQFLGDWAASDAALRRAANLSTRHGLAHIGTGAIHNRGRLAFLRGDLPEALRLMGQVSQRPGVAVTGLFLDYARVLVEAGRLGEAMESLTAAEGNARLRKVGHDLAEVQLEKARLLLYQGEAEEAASVAESAARSFRRHHESAWAAQASLLALSASLDSGVDPRRISTGLSRELARRVATGDVQRRAWLSLAQALALAGRTTQARVASARAPRHRSDCFTVRLQRVATDVTIHVAEGEVASARRELTAATRMLAREQARYAQWNNRTAIAVHSRRLRTIDFDLARDSGSAAALFAATERWRAVSHRLPRLVPASDEAIADLTAAARQVRLDRQSRPPDPGSTANAEIRDLERRLLARERQIAARQSGRMPRPRPPVRLPALRRQLSIHGSALLSFVAHRDSVDVVVVDERGARAACVGSVARVTELTARIRASLLALHRAEQPALWAVVRASLHDDLAQLSALIAPLVGDIDRLVIVPSQLLTAIPWRMLDFTQGRPVTVAPSATFWANRGTSTTLDAPPTSAADAPAIPATTATSAIDARARFAIPMISAADAPVTSATGPAASAATLAFLAGPDLPRASAEVTSAASHWPRSERKVADPAYAEDLLSALRERDVVHVAAHGVHHDESPLFSSIAMKDGPVFAYEVQRLELSARHVVLSACDVARAEVRPGDEALGLTSALLTFGVTSVIAAVAPVRDEEAEAVMTAYHRELASGADAALALARASASTGTGQVFCNYGSDWSPPVGSAPTG